MKPVLLILPLCVDNPGFHEHYEHNSPQNRVAVKKIICVHFYVFQVFLTALKIPYHYLLVLTEL